MGLKAKIHAIGVEMKDKDGKVTGIGKGNLSVYGMNSRFPVTLYPNQWLELLSDSNVAAIKALCAQGLKDGTLAGERQASAGNTNGRIDLAAFGKK